ncbi:hypothetical protein BCY76_013210 [Nesterenkonia sp. PF2B19]|nr:hypothetical protein BCY76_013210 [Nesterenkonia sp. PF2B19]
MEVILNGTGVSVLQVQSRSDVDRLRLSPVKSLDVASALVDHRFRTLSMQCLDVTGSWVLTCEGVVDREAFGDDLRRYAEHVHDERLRMDITREGDATVVVHVGASAQLAAALATGAVSGLPPHTRATQVLTRVCSSPWGA